MSIHRAMPHDRLFREMMRLPSSQQAFVKRYLPQNIQHLLDLSHLQQVPEHFAQAHKSVIPDCILCAPLKQGPGRFYLPIEQESDPREGVIVRLMLAKLRIIESELCSAQIPKVPPLIYSLLLCTGPRRYTGSLDLFENLHPEVKPLVRAGFLDIPHMIDLKDVPEVSHSNTPQLDAMTMLMKHIREIDLAQVLHKLEPLLQEVLERENGHVILNALLNYAIAHGSVNDISDITKARKALCGSKREMYMTAADILKQEGEKIGLQRGEEIGLQKGCLQIAKNMLTAGINPEVIAKVVDLSPAKLMDLPQTNKDCLGIKGTPC